VKGGRSKSAVSSQVCPDTTTSMTPPLTAGVSPPHSVPGDDRSVITQALTGVWTCCGLCAAGHPNKRAGTPNSNQHPANPANSNETAARKTTVAATAAVPDLPPGWKAVQSRSRPDRMAFQNELTGERISWVPTEPASTVRGEIRRSKRKSGKTRVGNSGSIGSAESDHTRNVPSEPNLAP
jgi:hypothetical protein